MSRGTVAFTKLKQLANPPKLHSVIAALNFGETGAYDPRSCAMNNIAIIKTLTNQQIPRTIFASQLAGMTMINVPHGMNGRHTEEAMRQIEAGKLVSFSLKFSNSDTSGAGDHHFSAFQLDDHTVVAAMGWQNVYDLSDYFAHNDKGRFGKTKFRALLRQIEDGNVEGVGGLCSFLGQTAQGTAVPGEIDREIRGKHPQFAGTMYFNLPEK